MCLAVPMCLESVAENRGLVAVEGVRRTVRLDLVPEARTGDWVLVHAGFAIQVMDEVAAAETLGLLRELEAAQERGGEDCPRAVGARPARDDGPAV